MRELELRGRLSEADYNRVEGLLKHRAVGKVNDKTSQFFQFDSGILKVSRHASTHKVILSLKLGDETTNNLEEHEIELAHDAFDKAIALLEGLGYTKRELVEQRRIDYAFDGFTVSLKHTADWGFHFEAERLLGDGDDEIEGRATLHNLCAELGIKPMTQQELAAFLKTISHQK